MATEFAFEDQILVLDGRVLEIFHSGTEESVRYHVSYLQSARRRAATASRSASGAPTARTTSPAAGGGK
jgi:hypothetical protein